MEAEQNIKITISRYRSLSKAESGGQLERGVERRNDLHKVEGGTIAILKREHITSETWHL